MQLDEVQEIIDIYQEANIYPNRDALAFTQFYFEYGNRVRVGGLMF